MKIKDIRERKKNHSGVICGPTGKKLFKSQKAAEIFGQDLLDSGEILDCNRFRAYRCEYCGNWHLTKKI